MSNLDEGNAFLSDASCSVCTLMCRYCKTTKDYIHEYHSVIKVFFGMMLIIVYILCCAGIAK
jgi:hypothetical protein